MDHSAELSSIIKSVGQCVNASDGKTSLTISTALCIVSSCSSEVITTANGIPDAVLVVDRMNTDVLNLSSDAVESQNTISLACWISA